MSLYPPPPPGLSPTALPAPLLQVYAITAVTSMFAYIWLLIMLMVWTPDRITVAEGVITFAMFWVLLFAAYAADKDFFRAKKPVAPEDEEYTGPAPTLISPDASDDVAVKNALKMTNGMSGMDDMDDGAKVDVLLEAMRPVTAATHTRNAMAWLTGKRPRPVFDAATGQISGMGGAGGIMKNPDGTPMKNPDGSPMKQASPKSRGTPSPNRMRTEANTSDPLFYVTRHIGFGDVQGEVFLSQDEAFAKFDEYVGGSDATGVWDAQLTQLKYYGGRDKRRPEEMKEWVTNFNRDEMQAPSSSWALPSRYPAIRAL